MTAESIDIPRLQPLSFKRDGVTLFEASMVSMNAALTFSQAGLDPTDPLYIQLYSERLCEYLKDTYKIELTADEAFVIGDISSRKLRETQASFRQGPK